MRRRKRRVDARIRLEEIPTRVVHGRPFAPEDQLHALFHGHAVDHRLSAEDAGLACVRALLEVSESIEGYRRGDESANHGVGDVDVLLIEAGIV